MEQYVFFSLVKKFLSSFLVLFFSFDRKEPKDQDCHKKSGNSTAHETSRTKTNLVRDETPEHPTVTEMFGQTRGIGCSVKQSEF
jgi:hypothetical protein